MKEKTPWCHFRRNRSLIEAPRTISVCFFFFVFGGEPVNFGNVGNFLLEKMGKRKREKGLMSFFDGFIKV